MMSKTKGARSFSPTKEMIILIAERLEECNTNIDISNALNAKSWLFNRFLNETDDPKIIKAKQIRKNIRSGRRKLSPATSVETQEEKSMSIFGMSLEEKSWENRLWMNKNGYELTPPKNYFDRATLGRTSRRRGRK